MRFRIIGNGAFGRALSKIFAKNVLLEDSMTDNIQSILTNDILIPAVPSNVVLSVIEKTLKYGCPNAIMLVSKGLASNSLLSNDAAIFKIPLLFFAGPNLAIEIEKNTDFLSATIAGPVLLTEKIASFLKDVVIDQTTDLILPQIAATMKNVTAFVVGYLQLTENARATLIMEGIKETIVLARFLGSTEQNLARACISDFILTCTSLNSRNFQAGQCLRDKMKNANICNYQTYESINSVKNIFEIKKDLKLPIVDFFHTLIIKQKEDINILENIV